MPHTYALLIGGVVTNLIFADQAFLDFAAGNGLFEVAVLIDDVYPQPAMGWRYSQATGFTNPDTPSIPE